MYAFGYLGAGIANILSGVIAHYFGLRMPYAVSLVPVAAAFALALSLPKDRPAALQAITPLRAYLHETVTTLRRSPLAGLFALQIVAGLTVFMTVCECGQIFMLSYGITTMQLGVLWAIDAAVVALGLQLAHRVQHLSWQTISLYAAALLLFGLVTHPLAIVIFMLVYTGVEIIHNVSETELQHFTSSEARATVLSSINFVGNLLALGAVWVFNAVYRAEGIHHANRMVAFAVTGFSAATAFAIGLHAKKNEVKS